jgi:hypothetical protein
MMPPTPSAVRSHAVNVRRRVWGGVAAATGTAPASRVVASPPALSPPGGAAPRLAVPAAAAPPPVTSRWNAPKMPTESRSMLSQRARESRRHGAVHESRPDGTPSEYHANSLSPGPSCDLPRLACGQRREPSRCRRLVRWGGLVKLFRRKFAGTRERHGCRAWREAPTATPPPPHLIHARPKPSAPNAATAASPTPSLCASASTVATRHPAS